MALIYDDLCFVCEYNLDFPAETPVVRDWSVEDYADNEAEMAFAAAVTEGVELAHCSHCGTAFLNPVIKVTT